MSLRARLLAGLAVVSFVLVGAAFIIARTTNSYLVNQLDGRLESAALRDLGAQPAAGDGSGPAYLPPTSLYVASIDQGVLSVRAMPNINTKGTPKVTVEQATAAARSGDPFTVGSTTGSERYRVLALRHQSGSITVVALSLKDVDGSMHRLRLVLVAAVGMVIGILGLVIFWVLRLGVRPIKRMTKTASAIAAGDLSRRVPDEHPGTEASELGTALNTMLTTIEDAFDQRAVSDARLRRFVADASHELRTPVTTIRGYAELYRHGGLDDPVELDQAMRRTEQESVRMASLVEDLLLLARLDEGRPLERATVDLGVLGVDAAADARAVAPDRVVTAEVAEGVIVEGDEHRLRQVFGNLVTNAIVHTPAGTPVSVRVHNGDGRAVVEVHDDGPGIDNETAARAFERFSRGDAARSRHAGGAGLGLAIVQAIVHAHDGDVSLQSAPDAGTTVRVVLAR